MRASPSFTHPGRLARLMALSFALLLSACGGGGGSATTPAAGDTTSPSGTPDTPSTTAQPPIPAVPQAVRFTLSSRIPGGLEVAVREPDSGLSWPLRVVPSVDGVTQFNPQSIVVDPRGRFAYVEPFVYPPPPVKPKVKVITLDPDTGDFVSHADLTLPVGTGLSDLQLSPFGEFAYVVDTAGALHAYRLGSDGSLSEVAGSPYVSRVKPTPLPSTVTVHPSGNFVYWSVQSVYTPMRVDRSTGALTAMPEIDFAPASAVWAGARYVWVPNSSNGYELRTVDPSTGNFLPAAAKPIVVPASGGLRADVSARYAVAGSQLYQVDLTAATATAVNTPFDYVYTLTPWAPEPVGTGAGGKVLVQVGNTQALRLGQVPGAALTSFQSVMYGIDPLNHLLRMFSQDPDTGALTPLATAPRPVAGRPEALAVAPTGLGRSSGAIGSMVAVASSNGALAGTLSFFPISDSAGGGASLSASTPTAPRPTSIAFDTATGRHVYTGHAGPDGIDAVDASALPLLTTVTGSPFPDAFGEVPVSAPLNGPLQAGTAPPLNFANGVNDIVIGSNDFLFVGVPAIGNSSDPLQGGISTLYVTNSFGLDGVHTGLAECAVGLPALGSTVSPAGHNTVGLALGNGVYALNHDDNTITGYGGSDGGCRSVPWMPLIAGSPFATGPQPVAIASDPRRSYLWVANSGGGGSISAYAMGSGGTLTPIAGSPFALGRVPARMWTDLVGKFLYVSDASGSVTVQKIDRTTGIPGTPHAAAPGQPMTIGVSALLSAH